MSAATNEAGSRVVTMRIPTGVRDSTAGASWEIWCGVVAVASSVIGMEWDIAWHRSIGRDTFWTPAHMMIQACGVITAVVCGYLVLACTWGKTPSRRARSVEVFGMRAPLGCFLAMWGGLAMLVSAPFDNWWHGAYGLDVQILSPPHVLLFLGLRLISAGFLLLIAGAMNRASAQGMAGAASCRQLRMLFLGMGGLIVTGHMLLLTVSIERPLLHTATAYKHMALGVLFLLPLLSKASRHRWAATTAVSVYMVLRVAEVLMFPLFPATPKLGPVLNPVTHLVPAQFPILLIVPAIALDLVLARTEHMKPWLLGMVSGVVGVGTLVAAEWPFADFLMTKASENRFFDTMDFDFSAPLADRVHRFDFVQSGWPLWEGLLLAMVYGWVACWVGIRLGCWMRSVQR